ncbi:GntR family transcriptional regulator [Paraferrimonas sp. SM1919]|uniref:GntR family transcriptional regulator n=1 Tax=Paraferrimonas sp. SM1919 TaxID=2662263 RepID=UPI0013D868EB|nr:GntR family transcriptional regulator [Paraferrimonas sp. SM1919]
MDVSKAIVYKTRTEQVTSILREQILSGEIAAGTPLRQSALAEALNVSRIPIREALVQLEAEGLVDFEAHKGATTSLLSIGQVTELFNLRAMIEPDLLEKAIPYFSEEHIADAELSLERLEKSFKEGEDIATWSELNTQFHTCLYRPAKQPYTLEVVQGLNTSCDRYIRLQLGLAGGVPQAELEHRELFKLCKDKNIPEAKQFLKNHILHAADSIIKLMRDQQN